MGLIQKNFSAKTESLSDNRQVRVIVSTGDMDRDGEIIDPAGVTWKAFMATGAGPVLWNHNSNSPIASASSFLNRGMAWSPLFSFRRKETTRSPTVATSRSPSVQCPALRSGSCRSSPSRSTRQTR